MVSALMNFGRSGLADWLVQRVSAVLMLAYTLFLLVYIGSHELTFVSWQALFSSTWMQVFSFVTLLSLLAHAWIGIWTVLTDYVNIFFVRMVLQIGLILLLISYLVWLVIILR